MKSVTPIRPVTHSFDDKEFNADIAVAVLAVAVVVAMLTLLLHVTLS